MRSVSVKPAYTVFKAAPVLGSEPRYCVFTTPLARPVQQLDRRLLAHIQLVQYNRNVARVSTNTRNTRPSESTPSNRTNVRLLKHSYNYRPITRNCSHDTNTPDTVQSSWQRLADNPELIPGSGYLRHVAKQEITEVN